MVEYCPDCGKILKENAEFCMYCGRDLRNYHKVSTIQHNYSKNNHDLKKQSRYILNDSQRKLFLYRILPLLIIGNMLWLLSEMVLSFLFNEASFTPEFGIIYISFMVADIFAFILFYLTARKNLILMSILFYLMFTCLAGAISLPIIILIPMLARQVTMFIVASFEGTIVVALVAIVLRNRYLKKGNIFIHGILFLIFLALAEGVFFIIFSIENWVLTLSITFPYILIVSLILLFYGAIAVKKEEKQPWPYILFKIISILLLSLIISIAVAIIVLIVIALAIICGDGSFDLSGLSFSGSGRRKKKMKKL